MYHIYDYIRSTIMCIISRSWRSSTRELNPKRLEILDLKCVAKNSPGFFEKFDHQKNTWANFAPKFDLRFVGINSALPKQMLH